MYCKECYFYHELNNDTCHYCGSKEFINDTNENEQIVYIDINKFYFSDLIKIYSKNNNFILLFLSLPVISIFYIIHKISHTPFLIPFAKSINLKKKAVTEDIIINWNSQSLKDTDTYLNLQGFIKLITYEDCSRFNPVITIVYVNIRYNHYASLEVNKTNKKAAMITFQIFSQKRFCLSVDNAADTRISYPKYVEEIHYPDSNVQDLYKRFCQHAIEFSGVSLKFSLNEYVPLAARLYEYSVDQAIEQKYLYLKNQDASHALQTCINHPMLPAVRVCSKCNAPLCEACYREAKFTVYCSLCINQKTSGEKKDAPVEILSQHTVASVVYRLASLCIDVCIFGVVTFIVYHAFLFLFQKLIPENIQISAALLCTLFMAAIGLFYYATILAKRSGTAFGKWIFGLKIVNKQGTPVSTIDIFVRFGLLAISTILVFPLPGYFFMLVNKKRQGFHDVLADTYVIKENEKKTRFPSRHILAHFIIIICISCLCVYGIHYYRGYLKEGISQKINLKKQWELPFLSDSVESVTLFKHNNICIIQNRNTIQACNLIKKEVLWKKEKQQGVWSVPLGYRNKWITDKTQCILIENKPEKTIASFDIFTGIKKWDYTLESYHHSIVQSDSLLLFFNDTCLTAVNHSGEKVWIKKMENDEKIVNVSINNHVFIKKAKGVETSHIILDLKNGTPLTTLALPKYELLLSLRDGYQLMKKGDTTILYSMNNTTTIWKKNLKISYVHAYHLFSKPDSEISGIVYTNSFALNVLDGTILFTYPNDSRIICVTANDIIFSNYFYNTNSKKMSEILVFCDKITGKIKTKLQNHDCYSFYKIDENSQYTFLGSIQYPIIPFLKSREFILWKINNENTSTINKKIGTNVKLFKASITNNNKLIFIQQSNELGLYSLERNIF